MSNIIAAYHPSLAVLELTSTPVLIGLGIALLLFIVLLFIVRKASRKESIQLTKAAEEKADDLRQKARLESENIIKEAKLKAREELERNRVTFERETADRKKELQRAEDRLSSKEDRIDSKANWSAVRRASRPARRR